MRNALGRVIRNRSAVMGSALALFYALMLICGALSLTPYSPIKQNPPLRLQAPDSAHPFGTDQFGRDIFSRVVRGSVNSLRIAMVAVAIACTAGTLIGMLSGYAGGMPDTLTMRVLDIFFAFPAILLALSVVAAVGPGANSAIPAIAIVYTPIFARVARAPVLSVKQMEYITAARAIGTSHRAILFRHILPNILAPVLVTTSLAFSWALLTEAGLSFLGLGPQPPEPSWGLMLKEGRNLAEVAPWQVILLPPCNCGRSVGLQSAG